MATLENFLENLPKVKRGVLEKRAKCTYCKKEFGTVPARSGIIEHAVRLPCCGKVIGSECIAEHLQLPKRSCPFCHHVFFSQPQNEIEIIDLTQSDDDQEEEKEIKFEEYVELEERTKPEEQQQKQGQQVKTEEQEQEALAHRFETSLYLAISKTSSSAADIPVKNPTPPLPKPIITHLPHSTIPTPSSPEETHQNLHSLLILFLSFLFGMLLALVW